MNTLKQQINALSDEERLLLADALGLPKGGTQLVAYFTSDESEPSTQKVQEHLRQHLPVHMQPAHVVHLNEMPVLSNGKLDIKSLSMQPVGPPVQHSEPLKLSDVEHAKTPIAQHEKASTSKTLSTLMDTLGQLLGIDDIRPDDNFFELGGDSITAIRLVSTLRETGIELKVADVANAATLSAMATAYEVATRERASPVPASTASQFKEIGDSPPTPIQRWFFAQRHPVPQCWNIGTQFELLHTLDAIVLEAALLDVLSSHAVLFTQFHLRSDGSTCCHYPDNAQVRRHQLAEQLHTALLNDEEFTRLARRCEHSFNLQQGKLVGVTIEVDNIGQACRLNMVIHHLLIDQLSIVFLMQQLEHRVRSLSSAARVEPDHSEQPLFMRQWAHMCADMSTSNNDSNIHPAPAQSQRLFSALKQTERDSHRHQTCLTEQQTTTLLSLCTELDVSITDVIVYALAVAWQARYGESSLPLDIESHGRDMLGDTVDASHSIGWFSSFYPSDIKLPGNNQPGLAMSLAGIADTLKTARNKGRQYLIFSQGKTLASHDARFAPELTSAPESSAHMAPTPNPARILLNFFGSALNEVSGSLFKACATDPDAPLRSADNFRAHHLEINAQITQKQLLLDWTVADACMDLIESKALAQSWQDALLALEAANEAYPEVNMTSDELDDFLDSLD